MQVHLGSLWTGAAAELQEVVVSSPLPGRPAAAALVDDWGCLRGAFRAWEGACGRLDQYGMQYSRVWANLCNAGVTPGQLEAQAAITCGRAEVV